MKKNLKNKKYFYKPVRLCQVTWLDYNQRVKEGANENRNRTATSVDRNIMR